MIFSSIQLAFPIIPITASCVTSSCCLMMSLRMSQSSDSATRLKTRATITIILVTLVYIVFNLPVFLNYCRFMISIYGSGKGFLSLSNSNKFLNYHIWVLTYVITVALNSLLNPMVYVLRMKSFRETVLAKLRGVPNNHPSMQSKNSLMVRSTRMVRMSLTDNNVPGTTSDDAETKEMNVQVNKLVTCSTEGSLVLSHYNELASQVLEEN